MHNINEQLFLFINGAAGNYSFLDRLFLFITDPFVYILIALVLTWFFIISPFRIKDPLKRLKAFGGAGLLSISLAFTFFITQIIKTAVGYPRPFQVLQNVNSLSLHGNFDSFPSAHSAFVFCIAMFVYYYSKSTGIILFALATLVAISRIFVGVHFPLDVIVGALIGVIVPWAIISVFKRYRV